MHDLIDDFAWIAVALVPLTLLFMVAAAIILLDERLRAIVRAIRNRAAAPSVSSQTMNPNSPGPNLRGKAARALKWAKAPIADSYRTVTPTIWHALRSKILEAGSQTSMRLRAGHHKS